MNIEDVIAIWKVYAHGQDMRIDYIDHPSGKPVPQFIGIAPLKCPEDVARWRIGVIYYNVKGCPYLMRDFAEQYKWSERASLL